MKLLNAKNQIKSFVDNKNKSWYQNDEKLFNKLNAIDPETITTAQFNKMFKGRFLVCPNVCSECNKESWDIVEIGQPPDYDSSTAYICEKCLKEALKLIEKSRKKKE